MLGARAVAVSRARDMRRDTGIGPDRSAPEHCVGMFQRDYARSVSRSDTGGGGVGVDDAVDAADDVDGEEEVDTGVAAAAALQASYMAIVGSLMVVRWPADAAGGVPCLRSWPIHPIHAPLRLSAVQAEPQLLRAQKSLLVGSYD